MNTMKITDAFRVLADIHGSHSQAAIACGFTPRHWRILRNGGHIPRRTEETIILRAKAALAEQDSKDAA